MPSTLETLYLSGCLYPQPSIFFSPHLLTLPHNSYKSLNLFLGGFFNIFLTKSSSLSINNLEQLIRGNSVVDEEIDHIQPYERDISMETRPQLNSAGLKEYNEHATHLSNHELHQIKGVHLKDNRKKIRTILDEPLGSILDNTINFLAYVP